MHCIFITRCTRPKNIRVVKESVFRVFEGSKHTFRHVLVCDFTDPYSDISDYEPFIGKNTTLFPVCEKRVNDHYATHGIDDALDSGGYETGYVYILDDDNQITPDFLDALDACEAGEPDAVVFKVYGHPEWGDISILDHDAIGKIDWANMLIRLDVMKRLKVYTLGADSQKSDGLFFEKMKREGCAIKFLNQICGRYNALPKP